MVRSLAPLLALGALAACTARLPAGAAYDSGVVVADADLSGTRPPDAAPRDAAVALLVGPEGGFDDAEVCACSRPCRRPACRPRRRARRRPRRRPAP